MGVSGGFQMELVPIELKLMILESCSRGADLAKLECLNSEWQGLVRSSGHLWEKVCYKMMVMETLPDSLKLKELPPEGLNWKELCILWTKILRHKFPFVWCFRERDEKGLYGLLRKALPHLSTPVRYYDFGDDSDSDEGNSE